ncbi:hypothetical protein DRQ26_07145 [bacterium]|nr:MAG: hypothetical protein DRQ26_07145 [bacterium]
MIITSMEELEELESISKVYVAVSPRLEINDEIFTFNSQANINVYHPIYVFMKESNDTFSLVEDGVKRCYDISFIDVIADIKKYDGFVTHNYYVSTSERETLQLLRKGLLAFKETVTRADTMIDRVNKEFIDSDFMQENFKDYPEDWV